MAELRHSSSVGSRATAASAGASPMKRDDVGAASSPLSPDNLTASVNDDDDGNNRNRHSRDRGLRSLLSTHLYSLFPFPFIDDARVHTHNSKILIFVLFSIFVAGVVSVSLIVNRLVSIDNLIKNFKFYINLQLKLLIKHKCG